MADGGRHEDASSAARLDGLLDSMEGFQLALSGSGKRGAVRNRSLQIELERCMDDLRAVLFQLLDPAERLTVVRTFSEASGVKRAARLEVLLKDDSTAANVPNDTELDEPDSPKDLSMQRTNSSMATYARKVRAVKSAYGAIKAVLDAKSQRLIERAVVSLEKEKINQELNAAAPQPSGNATAPVQPAQDSGVLRAHYEALRCLNDALVQELENYRGENERLKNRVAELEQPDPTDSEQPPLPNLDAEPAHQRTPKAGGGTEGLEVSASQHTKPDMEALEQKTDASSRPATQDLDSDRESDRESNHSSGSGSQALQPRHTVSGLNLMSPYARWAQRFNAH
mmetsp:Transcript_29/g.85  ORF Transcript_29/g.85 Transcript_29/m.85 type:complete len:340 (-) Transcript_29:72-1091(-)